MTTFPAYWKTCNCSGFYLPKGLVRTLLELNGINIDEEPCTHWESGTAVIKDKEAV
jgi:hypothetical protein